MMHDFRVWGRDEDPAQKRKREEAAQQSQRNKNKNAQANQEQQSEQTPKEPHKKKLRVTCIEITESSNGFSENSPFHIEGGAFPFWGHYFS